MGKNSYGSFVQVSYFDDVVHSQYKVNFSYTNASNTTVVGSQNVAPAPVWLRLDYTSKSGTTGFYTGYESLDGINWLSLGSTPTETVDAATKLGIEIQSADHTSLASAQYSNIKFAGTFNGSPGDGSMRALNYADAEVAAGMPIGSASTTNNFSQTTVDTLSLGLTIANPQNCTPSQLAFLQAKINSVNLVSPWNYSATTYAPLAPRETPDAGGCTAFSNALGRPGDDGSPTGPNAVSYGYPFTATCTAAFGDNLQEHLDYEVHRTTNANFYRKGGKQAVLHAQIGPCGCVTGVGTFVTGDTTGGGYTSIPKITLSGGGTGTNGVPTRNAVVTAQLYNQTVENVIVNDPGAGYVYEGNPTLLTVTVTIGPPDPNGETWVWGASGLLNSVTTALSHIELATTMSKRTNQSTTVFQNPIYLTNFLVPNCTIQTTLPDYNPTVAVSRWNQLGTTFFLMKAWMFRLHPATDPWSTVIQYASQGWYPGPLGYPCTRSQ